MIAPSQNQDQLQYTFSKHNEKLDSIHEESKHSAGISPFANQTAEEMSPQMQTSSQWLSNASPQTAKQMENTQKSVSFKQETSKDSGTLGSINRVSLRNSQSRQSKRSTQHRASRERSSGKSSPMLASLRKSQQKVSQMERSQRSTSKGRREEWNSSVKVGRVKPQHEDTARFQKAMVVQQLSKSRSPPRATKQGNAAAALMKAKVSPYYNDDIYLKESSVASYSMARSPLRESELSMSRSPSTRIGHSPGGMPKMVKFTGLSNQRGGLYGYQRSEQKLPKAIMKNSLHSPIRPATNQSFHRMSYNELSASMSRSRSRSKSAKGGRNNRSQ